MSPTQFRQEPMAVVGFACRLPGGNSTSQKLWEFLERGDIASSKVPKTRFNVDAHYDGSRKPGTMRQPGGMFLEDVDPADFDASFFEIGGREVIAMDPNQRQILEVAYEALENSGLPLEKISGANVGCFVGSYASDYGDMQNRDAADKPINSATGVGRSILANRLSYFLNIKGPSITIDTACSGSLVALDLACRALQAGEVQAALVSASNLYLNPDHAMDPGMLGQAYSPTALCHTFDAAADGYVKAEAVSCFVLKRLSDALRDRDPIRAVVRGTTSNSNGRTAGIASPSWEAQAAAIRRAYANAGITNLDETSYLECHGTGTQAGDLNEVQGAGSVFGQHRASDKPLIIGSIKSNVGHAEPAAGNSGLIKVILSMERGIIPGTPTFINPNPNINFAANKVKVSRTAITWPDYGHLTRRASVNSFGFGGSNAHAVIDGPSTAEHANHAFSFRTESEEENNPFDDVDESETPFVCVLSANDATSLKANIRALCAHLSNPRVKMELADLAYTLYERRTHLWHRAFISTNSTDIAEKDFTIGSKQSQQATEISMVFTGQGAQWSQMGQDMLKVFPWTRSLLEDLDQILQNEPDPPKWSIIAEMTESRSREHMSQPELSQTLVTALQLCIVSVLHSWNIKPTTVVGHSSGEIAAAYAAGLLDQASAIKAAFYRGRAAANRNAEIDTDVGMLAVGLDAESTLVILEQHVGNAWIACYNGPSSVTLSGKRCALEAIKNEVTSAGHFARLLFVDLAYHSPMMDVIADEYLSLLAKDEFNQAGDNTSDITMYSSVTTSAMSDVPNAEYWRANMVNPVRFHEALDAIIVDRRPSIIVEVGPAGALAGPISQILQNHNLKDLYQASWSRGENAAKSLFDVAGRLHLIGIPVDLSRVNAYQKDEVRTLVDLPNYSWNHSVKYWHESAASKDWRFKKFVTHEILGSKVPGTLWSAPTWRHRISLDDVPWLRDHHMGPDILMPGTGHVALAIEAMYQTYTALQPDGDVGSQSDLAYRLRNVTFKRAMVIEEDVPTTVIVSLAQAMGSKDWYEFKVMTEDADVIQEHSSGMIRVQDPINDTSFVQDTDLAPLKYPQSPRLWYETQREVGVSFGPTFQKLQQIEVVSGRRNCRAMLSLEAPVSKWDPATHYPLHPAVLDACIQTATPANVEGERSMIKDIMLPASIDEMTINKMPHRPSQGLSVARSEYTGRGRKDQFTSFAAHIAIHDPTSKALIMSVKGLKYVRLDAGVPVDPHVFHSITWKPDIASLDRATLLKVLPPESDSARIMSVIELIAHKTPALKVLEINLEGSDLSNIWFDGDDNGARAAYTRYDFASTNSQTVVAIEERLGSHRNTAFYLIKSIEDAISQLAKEGQYGLIVVKVPASAFPEPKNIVKSLAKLLDDFSYILMLHQADPKPRPNGHNLFDPSPDETLTPLGDLALGSHFQAIPLWRKNPSSHPSSTPQKSLEIVQFTPGASFRAQVSQERLSSLGWSTKVLPIGTLPTDPDSSVLVLDELISPLLRSISQAQWAFLQDLISTPNPLLWLTASARTEPDRALVQGLFRTVRRERPDAKLAVLDLETSTADEQSIGYVLDELRGGAWPETEYSLRGGILHTQRVRPDSGMNAYKATETGKGPETEVRSLHGAEEQVRLQAEKVGTLESLTWCETGASPDLERGEVEVEIMAVGVNFKDVATVMGLVPGNEHMTGCECAGIVRRVTPGEKRFQIGERVVAMGAGAYANRARFPAERVHLIPETMSFDDAATVPLVYLTAIYSLFNIANLEEGQTVLIHSAAGGVGLAAVQLAQYTKAEIFATVGTDEKREYLTSEFGIPSDHMFSSRSTKFAQGIRHITHGRGVDVVLNSLTGELLDESWRLLADGGVMVEIGKRDIVNHSTLAMDPFDRSCSYRAVDLSSDKRITHALIGRLLKDIFTLIDNGHIKPIRPIHKYQFDEVVSALSCIRRGQHMGKIIISREGAFDVDVPIRPATRRLQLRPEASYLIVGGLKGLCGSVAIHLARHGARHLTVISRSGLKDEASGKVIRDCEAHGCEVQEARGDVADFDFVLSVFRSSSSRKIAGVIQGAMVLRDKPFETMSHEDYHTAISAKTAGTWNLHLAAQRESSSPLDFFTMLSSLSGVVGNKGQANYSAANTFLDAFSTFRQSAGLRAHTINLGVVADVGYVAEQGEGLSSRFDERQWTPIKEDMLRKLITYSILQQQLPTPISESSKAQMITGLGYPLPKDGSNDLVSDRRFSYLFADQDGGAEGSAGQSNGDDAADQATKVLKKALESGAAQTVLVEASVGLLQSQVTKLLRLETEVEPGKPPTSYGLDSLSAVELRGWVRQSVGAELSTLDITNASSLVSLSDKLVSKLVD